MPSALTSKLAPGVGQSETVAYSPAATVTATLIGILCANNADGGAQKVSLRIKRGAVYCNIIKGAPLPVGDTFVPTGMEGKLVLLAADELRVSVDVGTVDVTVSMLEQTP